MDELLKDFYNAFVGLGAHDDEAYSPPHESAQPKNLMKLPPDPRLESEHSYSDLEEEDESDPVRRAEFFKSITKGGSVKKLRFPPPDVLPCANVQVAQYRTCGRPGTKTCTDCRLVSYCSKECQKLHWKKHKDDCRNPIRSNSWVPIWTREGRIPSFIVDEPLNLDGQFFGKDKSGFSTGIALWGNTPAIDVINFQYNEEMATNDLTLAFIASGDLRHILRTINGLPESYTGRLTILLNDLNPVIVCRNIILLLVLGTIEDKVLAADIALHFWYSVFMPVEYRLHLSWVIRNMINQILEEGKVIIPLGPTSTLSCAIPQSDWVCFFHFISSSLTMDSAQMEYDRVRSAPSRRDLRGRLYAGLRPSHRAAFQQYRRFGIILPFGAINAHFNYPNHSLFSAQGAWLQTDYADPLHGWDITSVLAAGKLHGAQPEDIYGCLYFFLSDELRKLAQRIQKFEISFTLTALNAASILSKHIQDGALSEHGIPRSIRFDRIAVSNILDVEYVGIKDVLWQWSPFLADSPNATILGYFMNWVMVEPEGRSITAGSLAVKDLTRQNIKKTMKALNISRSSSNPFRSVDTFTNMAIIATIGMDAHYDNSIPFMKFLKKQGIDEILRKTTLKLRMKHTILPHRIHGPLQGEPKDLPIFLEDNEIWYYHTKLTCFTWSERYVEFTR